MSRSRAEYTPFPSVGGCARLAQFRWGLRFTVRLRTGVVYRLPTGRRFSRPRRTAKFHPT
jgi:hypothetical protein